MMKAALADCGMSEPGQQRKSDTASMMSVKPPKAEVAIHGADVRYVPKGDISGV